MGGQPVGIIASNPMFTAGALTTDAVSKMTPFACLCEAYNLPIIFLVDTPGFIVGKQPEHDRLLHKAIMWLEALSHLTVPRFTLTMRKAFGLAYFAYDAHPMGAFVTAAWPAAEISFMDPQVGVNVVYADKVQRAADPDAERARLIAEWAGGQAPDGAAGIMNIDEIIDPAETRPFLLRCLEMFPVEPPPRGQLKPLAYWPTCY